MKYEPPKYSKIPKPDPPPRIRVLDAYTDGDGKYCCLVIKWQKSNGHGEPGVTIVDLPEDPNA